MEEFDVVVVGAGPAGEVIAGRCAAGGLRVALVERELVGGECSYWACIPSKTLIRPGDVIAAARRTPGPAQAITGPIDVAAALARRDEATHRWDDTGALTWVHDNAIVFLRGHARIDGIRSITVEERDGSAQHVTARRAVVVATGTRATIPP